MSDFIKQSSLYVYLGSNSTVKDLREFVQYLDLLKIPDHHLLEECNLGYYYSTEPELIINGDKSYGGNDVYDILVPLTFDDNDEIETGC